jgi:flagellar motor switch protein FliG
LKLSDIEKVAVALVAMGEKDAGRIVAGLPRDLARKVLQAVSRLGTISSEDAQEALRQVTRLVLDVKPGAGLDVEKRRRVVAAAAAHLGEADLSEAFGDEALLADIRAAVADLAPRALATWLSAQRPQVGACVVALSEPACAARVLPLMPHELRTDIALAVATLGSVERATLEDLLVELRALRQNEFGGAARELGGTEKVIALVRALDQSHAEDLLGRMEEREPELAARVRAAMVTPERLAALSRSDLAKIAARVGDKELSLTIRHLPDDERRSWLAAVSSARASELQDLCAAPGRDRREDLEAARKRLVETAMRLEAEGGVVFPWKDEFV